MPETPIFQPAAAPGSTATAVQSYMDRASSRRMAQETHAMEMQQASVLLPVVRAKATADVAAANNQLAGMKQIEEMRAVAHGEMPGLRDEWSRASQINDPGERVKAMTSVLGRAAKYESVAEMKGEIDVWKNVLASAAITQRTLEAVNTRMDAAAELEKAKATHAKELEAVRGENAQLKQESANRGKVEAAKVGASRGYEHLVQSYQAAVAAGDDETAALLDAQIKRRNHIAQPYSDAERIKTLDAEAKEAEKEGDVALAKSLRARIEYLTKRGGGDREAKLQAILGNGGGTAAGGSTTKPAPSTTAAPAGTNQFQGVKF